MKILPPSNPFMGNKFNRAKKKQATAKKIRRPCLSFEYFSQHITAVPPNIFANGPDNDNMSSFLYEYIGSAIPNLAPKISIEKLLIFIFNIIADAI